MVIIITKILMLILLILQLVCPVFALQQAKNVVVSVNGSNIFEAEVQIAVSEIVPRGLFHSGVTPEKLKQFRKAAIDAVIDRELLYQEGKRLGLSVNSKEIKEVVQRTASGFKKKKDFYKALENEGLTEDTFKKIIEKDILSKRVLKQEVEEKITLSESDLETYYNNNKEKFFLPEKIRLREIFISVSPSATEEERKERKKKAEEVLAKAKSGEDFANLAYEYSENAFKVKGGDLGLVHIGRLAPELDEAGLRLNVGEMDGPIETIYGYHIVRLEEKESKRQLNFPEVKDSLKKELEAKRYKETKDKLLKSLKEKAKIAIY